MTTITVDPGELTATADLLRACAAEAADVGTALWACADCAMPAQVRSLVDQLVAAADRALDVSALQLSVWANDLANRAQIAYTDALTASSITSSSSGPPTVPVVAGAGLIGGGFGTANVTIGDSTTSYGSGAGLIGGGFGTYDVTISDVPAGFGANAGLIGGPGRTGNLFTQMADILQSHPKVLAALSLGNDMTNYGINQFMSPSESDIKQDNPGMSSSYIASMFPYAGPNPYVSVRIPGL